MTKRNERTVEPHRDVLVLEHGRESLSDRRELIRRLTGRDTTDPLDIGVVNAHRVRERGCPAAQQRLLRMLHTLHKQLAMTLDRLIGYGLCSPWP